MDSLLDTVTEKSLLDSDSPGMGVGCVYLMRHGQTVLDVDRRSDGWLDMPLSDAGQLGLILAQQALKTIPIKTILCANLKRTRQTAELIKSGTLSDPELVIASEARTWNLGIIAGTRKRYGRPEVQKLIDSPDRAPMGGESFNDFKDRFLPWFDEQTADASRVEPVLYVGSGSNMRLIGQELLGDPDTLDLDEASLVCLHKVGSQWTHELLVGADDEIGDIS